MKIKSLFICVLLGLCLNTQVRCCHDTEDVLELPRMPRPKIDDSSLLYRAAASFAGVFYGQVEAPGEREFHLASCYVYGAQGKPVDPALASYYLFESALKNNADALMFIGLLMVNMHGDELSDLAQCIGFNDKTGPEYLRRAKELGAEPAQAVLEGFSSVREISRLCDYARSDRQIDLRRSQALLKKIAQSKNPMNCYFVAEALLRPQSSILLKPVHFVLDGQTRRQFSLKMLSVALEYKVDSAQKLLKILQDEDRGYEAICEMMKKDIEKGVNVKGLEIGDAGFQEAYIDQLYLSKTRVLGRLLDLDDCQRFKQSMSLRVRSLFHAFSGYFQCMNSILTLQGQKSTLTMAANLDEMVAFASGKVVFPIPKLVQGKLEYQSHSILRYGAVATCIQPIEAERAFAMLMECSDDFKDIDVTAKNRPVQQQIKDIVMKRFTYTSCVAMVLKQDLFKTRFLGHTP